MVHQNPFMYRMAVAAVVLATVMPLASGTTSASTEVCPDELATCLADADCTSCAASFNTGCAPSDTTTTIDVDAVCETQHDAVCCAFDTGDCQENELMMEFFDCVFLESGCTEDFDCTDSSDTSANGATGIVNSAVLPGCLALAPFVGIMTTVFATG